MYIIDIEATAALPIFPEAKVEIWYPQLSMALPNVIGTTRDTNVKIRSLVNPLVL